MPKKQERESKPLTRAAFHALLRRAAQPIPKEVEQPAPVESETSELRRPDGCTETCKSPDTLEGGED